MDLKKNTTVNKSNAQVDKNIKSEGQGLVQGHQIWKLKIWKNEIFTCHQYLDG